MARKRATPAFAATGNDPVLTGLIAFFRALKQEDTNWRNAACNTLGVRKIVTRALSRAEHALSNDLVGAAALADGTVLIDPSTKNPAIALAEAIAVRAGIERTKDIPTPNEMVLPVEAAFRTFDVARSAPHMDVAGDLLLRAQLRCETDTPEPPPFTGEGYWAMQSPNDRRARMERPDKTAAIASIKQATQHHLGRHI